MAAAAIATLSLSSSVPCKKQPRLGGSSFSARELGGSSSRWHTINLRSRAPAPRPRTAKNRVIVARAGSYKVAILGAAGGVGQPLSLLVKMSPFVSTLHLYDDTADVKGVAADLSHCNTPAQVAGFTGRDELAGSLDGADVVVVTAGAPRTKPGATTQDDDDLFSANAGVVMELVEAVADHAPGAMVHVVSEPVNSTVPLAAEVLRRKGAYDPRKLFGVTTHAVVRANALVAARKGLPLADVDVPVVGGGSDGTTVLPLLSKARPKASFTDEEAAELTARIRNDGAEADGAPLSTAYAAARFVEASLRGLNGDGGVYECAYVQSQVVPELPFFVCRVRLGRDGVEEVVAEELKGLTDYETRELEALKPELKASIDRGMAYVQQQPTTAAFN